MKKFLVLTIVSCLAAACCVSFAANAADKYPENDSFTKHVTFTEGITDYAVGDGDFAFAHGDSVSVVGGGEKRPDVTHVQTIEAVEFYGGEYYFLDNGGRAFPLSDPKNAAEGVVFQTDDGDESGEKEIMTSQYAYLLLTATHKLSYRQRGTSQNNEISGEFSHLKLYGGEAYVMKEGDVYKLNGSATEKITGEDGSLTYQDFSETEKIEVPDTIFEDLRSPHLEFVTLTAGAYYSEVNIENVDADGTFSVDESTTVKANGETALLVCRTGDSAIVARGGKSYILLSSNVKTNEAAATQAKSAISGNASILEPIIYSTPFASKGTKIADPAAGKSVTLLSKITSDVLGFDFYEVEYTQDSGEKVKGYMPKGFLLLNGIYADDDNPTLTPAPDYSEETAVRTVLLILIIVALLLAALGYVIFVVTGDKRKKKKSAAADEPLPPEENK